MSIASIAEKAAGSLLPWWWKLAAGGAIVLALGGGVLWLRSHWINEGRDQVKAEDAQALQDQRDKDKTALSQAMAQLDEDRARIGTAREDGQGKVNNAPSNATATSADTAGTDAAIDWMRGRQADRGGGAPAR